MLSFGPTKGTNCGLSGRNRSEFTEWLYKKKNGFKLAFIVHSKPYNLYFKHFHRKIRFSTIFGKNVACLSFREVTEDCNSYNSLEP